MTGLTEIEVAGWATALGMDGMRLLDTRDPVERTAMTAVVLEARKARKILDNELAARLQYGPEGGG